MNALQLKPDRFVHHLTTEVGFQLVGSYRVGADQVESKGWDRPIHVLMKPHGAGGGAAAAAAQASGDAGGASSASKGSERAAGASEQSSGSRRSSKSGRKQQRRQEQAEAVRHFG